MEGEIERRAAWGKFHAFGAGQSTGKSRQLLTKIEPVGAGAKVAGAVAEWWGGALAPAAPGRGSPADAPRGCFAAVEAALGRDVRRAKALCEMQYVLGLDVRRFEEERQAHAERLRLAAAEADEVQARLDAALEAQAEPVPGEAERLAQAAGALAETMRLANERLSLASRRLAEYGNKKLSVERNDVSRTVARQSREVRALQRGFEASLRLLRENGLLARVGPEDVDKTVAWLQDAVAALRERLARKLAVEMSARQPTNK